MKYVLATKPLKYNTKNTAYLLLQQLKTQKLKHINFLAHQHPPPSTKSFTDYLPPLFEKGASVSESTGDASKRGPSFKQTDHPLVAKYLPLANKCSVLPLL